MSQGELFVDEFDGEDEVVSWDAAFFDAVERNMRSGVIYCRQVRCLLRGS